MIMFYFVIGIIWLVMINVASLIENRKTGISECEKACIKNGTSINTVPKKILFLSCILHIVIWPFAIPYYVYTVYLKEK